MASQTNSKIDLDALVVQVEGQGDQIDSGSYGVVFEVTVNGRKCVAKKLHDMLLEAGDYCLNFLEECRILSSLNHPNVVGFVGVQYGYSKNDISLMMERLNSNLANFIEKNPGTSTSDRIHILHDVSKGLHYLHSLTPPLIHCDLCPSSILLTEDGLTAKIGSFSVAKYADPLISTLSDTPGSLLYMPPECQAEHLDYNTKLDIFSFGVLILYTFIDDRPGINAIPPPTKEEMSEGKVELMRRNSAIHKMGENHSLHPLVMRCLNDHPE
ncbi:serine/threonine-protein kinase TNNI3K-like [Halichondria panicea]|uniref:serine/threonine-protein kinase TNNI3K-like n=1 Tax=Halichondria panicea TaxID=6063 RepID=UPI00312B33C8